MHLFWYFFVIIMNNIKNVALISPLHMHVKL